MSAVAMKRATEAHTGHRFSLADMAEMELWLIGRIREKYPFRSYGQIKSWLIGCMTQNDILFVRAGGGVAMVQLHQEFLSKFPWAQTIFVLAQKGKMYDAAGLFQDIKHWTDQTRCTKLIINEDFCDVERADIGMEIATPRRVPISVIYFKLHNEQATVNV